jgi:hypothetical protein
MHYKPTGDRYRFRNIFIVTYGRSGSTLLQGILNSIEWCLIRGENNNFVYHMFKSYQAIRLAKNNKKAMTPQKAWYGANLLDDEYFLEVLRGLIKKLILADNFHNSKISCYGFKEIRYIDIMDDLIDYLDFLKKLFPHAAFIFNFRNADDVCKSGWWKEKDNKEVRETIKTFEERCFNYSENNVKICFFIKYEEVINRSQRLKDLFYFLGANYDDKKIETILSMPHSYDPEQTYVKDLFNQYAKK